MTLMKTLKMKNHLLQNIDPNVKVLMNIFICTQTEFSVEVQFYCCVMKRL